MLLFRDKQTRLILILAEAKKEWYLSNLAREAGVTYIHTSRFIGRCKKEGLVDSESHGKLKRVFLTEKGRAIANGIQALLNKMKEAPQASPEANPAFKQPPPQPSSASS